MVGLGDVHFSAVNIASSNDSAQSLLDGTIAGPQAIASGRELAKPQNTNCVRGAFYGCRRGFGFFSLLENKEAVYINEDDRHLSSISERITGEGLVVYNMILKK